MQIRRFFKNVFGFSKENQFDKKRGLNPVADHKPGPRIQKKDKPASKKHNRRVKCFGTFAPLLPFMNNGRPLK